MKIVRVIIIALVVFFVIGIIAILNDKDLKRSRENYTTMRCPTCGAEARVRGDQWECTWCGDFGRVEKF